MSCRLMSRFALATLALALTGCTEADLAAILAEPPTAGAGLPTATGGGAVPPATGGPSNPTTTAGAPAPSVPVGVRAERDRPDELSGHQVHAFYVVPSDATDRRLDTDGTIAGWIQDGADWLKAQSGGSALRYDTAGGQPDITFFRTRYTEAELYAKQRDILDALDDEIRRAGHNDPLKVNVYFYDGRCGREKTAGLGGNMAAGIFLTGLSAPQMTVIHEVFHALGAVPETAPNRAADAHVLDDPLDLMSPARAAGVPKLDVGRNDYWGHGRSGVFDMARSPFLVPTPADVRAPFDTPAATTVGADAVAWAPQWRAGDMEGDRDIESAAEAMLATIRQDAGLAPLPLDARLQTAARGHAAATGPLTSAEASRLAGYGSFAGSTTVTLTMGTGDDVIGRVEGYLRQYRSSFATLVNKPELTEVAVGATFDGKKAKLSFFTGRRAFEIDSVRLGAGPFGTRTLVGKAKLRPGQTYERLRVRVGEQYSGQTYWLKPGEAAEFHASVPTTGRHQVTILAGKAGETTVSQVAAFTIDGAAPLATAFAAD